jgi:hypothetical protein
MSLLEWFESLEMNRFTGGNAQKGGGMKRDNMNERKARLIQI